ncbi:MAG: DMT family transporter [Candidatus Caldarchaeales archaeon]
MEPVGVALALGTAFLWALTSVAMRRATRDVSPVAASAVASLTGLLIALAATLAELSAGGRVQAFSGGLVEAVAAGALVFGIGRLLWYYGISKIGASRSNAIAASETLIAPLVAVVLAGESPSALVLTGCAMVAAGVAIVSLQRNDGSSGQEWTLGVAASAGAALSFALGATYARIANVSIGSPFLTTLISTATSLLMMLLLTARTGGLWKALGNGFALAGSLANGLASVLFWGSLYLAPVSLAVPLTQTFPLFTLVITLGFARALEHVDARTAIGAIAVTAGAVMVTVS